MSKDAPLWMPLYVPDYLKDTMHLSTVEHGAYLLLIMHAWTHGGLLPIDETRLSRIARLSADEWKDCRDAVLEFFQRGENSYRHNRVDEEIAKAEGLVEQRRAAGRASAEARKNQRESQRKPNGRSTSVATDGQRKPNQSQSQEAASAASARAREAENGRVVSLTVRLCKAAGIEMPDPGRNFAKHGEYLSLVAGWLEAGADPAQIERCVAARAEQAGSQVKSLKYFEAAVRDSLAKQTRQEDGCMAMVRQILKEQAA